MVMREECDEIQRQLALMGLDTMTQSQMERRVAAVDLVGGIDEQEGAVRFDEIRAAGWTWDFWTQRWIPPNVHLDAALALH